MLESVLKTQRVQNLCDHQELACTPKDPPRRVNMKETSFRNVYGTIDWVFDKTVSEPTLVTPSRFAEKNVVTGIACCNRNELLNSWMLYC